MKLNTPFFLRENEVNREVTLKVIIVTKESSRYIRLTQYRP